MARGGSTIFLELSPKPPERFAFVRTVIEPLLGQHQAVKLRFFDAEAFSTVCSDLLMWETQSLEAYQSLVEGLRESPFWGHSFDVLHIVPAVENGYATHYQERPIGVTAGE